MILIDGSSRFFCWKSSRLNVINSGKLSFFVGYKFLGETIPSIKMINQSASARHERVSFLDATRASAIFMVLVIHACEFFYIGSRAFTPDETFWSGIVDSALRIAVPLFVMVSSYLLVPSKDEMEVFYRKRLPKILIPFLIWSVAYAALPALWGAFAPSLIAKRIAQIPFMFNDGHLWYIYMFVGIYLFIPILSPWLKQASQKQLQLFLGFWGISLFHHYLKFFADTNEWISIFGECKWNEFSTFWYFSGYLGYVVLAYYLRTYVHWERNKSLIIGALSFISAWAIGYFWFMHYYSTGDLYIYEIAWRYCSPNVALGTFGFFIIMKSFPNLGQSKFVQEISKSAYGIYLCHIFLLNFLHTQLGFITSVPLKIILYSTLCLALSYLLIKVLSYLPYGRYLTGR